MRSRLGNRSVLPTSKKMNLIFEFVTTKLNHYSESKVAMATDRCRALLGLDGAEPRPHTSRFELN